MPRWRRPSEILVDRRKCPWSLRAEARGIRSAGGLERNSMENLILRNGVDRIASRSSRSKFLSLDHFLSFFGMNSREHDDASKETGCTSSRMLSRGNVGSRRKVDGWRKGKYYLNWIPRFRMARFHATLESLAFLSVLPIDLLPWNIKAGSLYFMHSSYVQLRSDCARPYTLLSQSSIAELPNVPRDHCTGLEFF